MTIAMSSDHAGYELKRIIAAHLEAQGYEVIDFGPDTGGASADYPVYGERAAQAVASGVCALGILVCGTGIGISLTANKVRGIRAVSCSEPYSAKMGRMHNDANVLCLGARVVGSEMAKMIVDVFMNAQFEGGRHQRRVDMIMRLERDGHL